MKTQILLFTGEAIVSKAIAEIARVGDWDGTASNNVHEVVRYLGEYEWDIVIVDIGPRGIGFLILDALEKADDETPAIALTEKSGGLYQALALANGASEVLAKPVIAKELREAVDRLCQQGFRT